MVKDERKSCEGNAERVTRKYIVVIRWYLFTIRVKRFEVRKTSVLTTLYVPTDSVCEHERPFKRIDFLQDVLSPNPKRSLFKYASQWRFM